MSFMHLHWNDANEITIVLVTWNYKSLWFQVAQASSYFSFHFLFLRTCCDFSRVMPGRYLGMLKYLFWAEIKSKKASIPLFLNWFLIVSWEPTRHEIMNGHNCIFNFFAW